MNALSGNLFKLCRVFEAQILLFCCEKDACADRVGGSGLTCSCSLKDFGCCVICGRNNFLDNEIALCDVSFLIHDDGLYIFQCFQGDPAFKEDPFSGSGADPGEECERYA